MDWLPDAARISVAAITAFAGLAGAVGTLFKDRGHRTRLKNDLEIMNALPEGSSRSKLERYVEQQVDALISYETEASRQVALAVFTGLLAIGLTALSWWLLTLDGFWWLILIGSVPLAAILAYGVFESAARVPRDEKGNRT